MKIETKVNNITRSETFREYSFGIGDPGFIMEILRSKMYPVPIKTIVQEISSNARDAHREVGKDDVPIHITLPSRHDMTFRVRDFGPGMTPDRVEQIFTQYGRSTKRQSNDQTGGFGIGAKSPWAYSDSFTVASVTPDKDGTMMKRVYAAYIDETRCGKMALMFEEPTKEEQGTLFEIPCKPKDVEEFRNWCIKTFQFWKVRPKVSPEVIYEKPNFVIQGKGWAITPPAVYSWNDVYKKGQDSYVVLDGICYPLSVSKIPTNAGLSTQERDFLTSQVYVWMETGKVSVAANRDELEYNDKTIAALKIEASRILKEFADMISDRVADAATLWEAYVEYNKFAQTHTKAMPNANYAKNNVVLTSQFRLPIMAKVEFWRASRGTTSQAKTTAEQITLRRGETIRPAAGTKLVFDDTGTARPSRGRIAAVFNKYPDINNVYIIQPTDKALDENTIDANLNFRQLGALRLSQFEPVASVRTGSSSPQYKAFMIKEGYWQNRQGVDISSVKTEVAFVEVHEGALLDSNGKVMGELSTIAKLVPLYAIPKRFVAKRPKNMIWADEFIKNRTNQIMSNKKFVDCISDVLDLEGALSRAMNPLGVDNLVMMAASDTLTIGKLWNPDCTLTKLIQRAKIANEMRKWHHDMTLCLSALSISHLHKLAGTPNRTLYDLAKQVLTDYPMLNIISRRFHELDGELISGYVNLVDKSKPNV